MRQTEFFNHARSLLACLCVVSVFSFVQPAYAQMMAGEPANVPCVSMVSLTVRNAGKIAVNVFISGELKITGLAPGKSQKISGLCKGMQVVQAVPVTGKYIPTTRQFIATRPNNSISVSVSAPAKPLK